MATMTTERPEPVVDVDRAEALAAAGDCVFAAARAEADLLEVAVRWADLNPVTEESAPPADWWDGEGVPVHSAIPEVTQTAVVEFAARIDRPTSAGKWLMYEALQLRHRMPRTWRLVQQCRMPAAQARRLVMGCHFLNDEAVDWLDRQVDTVAGRIGPTQLERMINRAASEFDPQYLRDKESRRFVKINHGDPNSGLTGSGVHGVIDPLDALDLDDALNAGAEARKQFGSTGDRDARRAEALGDLARARLGQEVLPLGPDGEPSDGGSSDCGSDPAPRSDRRMVPPLVSRPRDCTIYVHLSEEALRDRSGRMWLAEFGTTGQTITADLVRDWCGNPDLQVTIKSVIDLREPIITDTYQPSRSQREHVALTDERCGFAHCTRPIHPVPTQRKPDGTLDDSWDADHTRAWRPGEQTSTDGLVGLCRQHHRSKTLHGWSYRRIAPGLLVWRSPYGYDYLRTPTGTTSLGRHRKDAPPVPGWLTPGPLRPPEPDEPPDPPPDDPG